MPPKKRTGVTTATKPEELTKPPATTIPEPKKEEVKVEVKPAESIAKLSVVQSAEKQSTWAVSKEETKSNKVVNTNVSQLSEEELLRLRKLRFSVVGTDVLPDDAEKLKTERLKKFGGTSMLDEKEEL